MLQRANTPYVHAFFNYLSIVEICIDKGLSGGDLCSCQLSQRTVPLRHPLDRSACKTRLRGLSGGLRRQFRSMWAKKRVSRLGKTSSSGGIDGTGWPLTWGRAGGAGGGSAARLKPLWVSASCWDLTLAMTHPGFRMTLTRLQTGRVHTESQTHTRRL